MAETRPTGTIVSGRKRSGSFRCWLDGPRREGGRGGRYPSPLRRQWIIDDMGGSSRFPGRQKRKTRQRQHHGWGSSRPTTYHIITSHAQVGRSEGWQTDQGRTHNTAGLSAQSLHAFRTPISLGRVATEPGSDVCFNPFQPLHHCIPCLLAMCVSMHPLAPRGSRSPGLGSGSLPTFALRCGWPS